MCLCVCHFGCGDCPKCGNLRKLWLCVAVSQRAWVQCDNTNRVLAHYSQSTGALPQRTGRVLPEYCHSTAKVLVQYSQNTGTTPPESLPQYYQSTGALLKEYWHNSPRTVGECPAQSTCRVQKAYTPPEYSQRVPKVAPDQPHSTDFSTAIVQTQTTKPAKGTPTCHQPKAQETQKLALWHNTQASTESQTTCTVP